MEPVPLSGRPALINAVNSNSSGTYALSRDSDAAQDGSYPHSPVATAFNGIFEGLGNAIANLSIFNSSGNSEQFALFAQVGSTGQLNDAVVSNISMQAKTAYLAPLAGINNGTITHSSATGSLSGLGLNTWSMAGLVIENHGTITRSHASVTMDGLTESAGGLATSNYGTITLSDASGAVKAVALAGGLVGYSQGAIAQSSATGDVSVSLDSGASAGGLVGQLQTSGTISESFATGNVSGGVSGAKGKQRYKHRGLELGGLAGYSGGAVQYSYATGSVTANASPDAKHAQVGGLAGSTSSNPQTSHIMQAYSLGHVSLNDKKYIGGSIGEDFAPQGNQQLVFWDLDTSGITNPNQGAGNLFDDQGLTGVADPTIRPELTRQFAINIWAEDPNINNGYPYLINNPPGQQ